MVHEMMKGYKPYPGQDRISYKEQILAEQKCLKKQHVPELWTLEASDFVNKCI